MQSVAINWYEANIKTPELAKRVALNFASEYILSCVPRLVAVTYNKENNETISTIERKGT